VIPTYGGEFPQHFRKTGCRDNRTCRLVRLRAPCARCKAVVQRWPDAPQIERVCLIAAMAEMARTNYAEASPHLERLLTAYPKSANRLQAELLLAQCLHHLNRADDARRSAGEAVAMAAKFMPPENPDRKEIEALAGKIRGNSTDRTPLSPTTRGTN
jgi:hypothetical protein